MKREDLTGQRFGRLVALKYLGDCKYECKCDCGNTKIVRTGCLKHGNTRSCGCLARENHKNAKPKDHTGEVRGNLEILERVGRNEKNETLWRCKCHACGNIVVRTNTQILNYTSCGCVQKKTTDKNNGNLSDEYKFIRKTHTNSVILREAANANSKTGIRGVCYDEKRGVYIASIQYKKKKYRLKESKDINECIKSRKEAEEKIRELVRALKEDFKNS